MKWLIHVTAWERASVVRRMLLALIRVTLLVGLITILIDALGPPLGIYFMTRSVARRVPWVRVAPKPLADYSVSSALATSLNYFGYEFEVPWNSAFKTKGGKASIVQLQFDSGQNLTFIVPANQNGLLSEIAQDRSLNLNFLQPGFGDLTNSSAYDQYAALLSTTPQSIRAFGPRAQAVRGTTLLTIKAISLGPGLETGVFSFKFAGKRGFEIGDPQKSKRVDLEVFGMGGREVEMLLFAGKGTARLSQSDINRILTSLHPLSGDSPVTAAAQFAVPQSHRN